MSDAEETGEPGIVPDLLEQISFFREWGCQGERKQSHGKRQARQGVRALRTGLAGA